jgi:hypothetical protein
MMTPFDKTFRDTDDGVPELEAAAVAVSIARP